MQETCNDEFVHPEYGLLKCDLSPNHYPVDENHYAYEVDVDWPVDAKVWGE